VLNRLATQAFNGQTPAFGFGYDALSRRTSLTRPNGVNTTYGYDPASNRLSVRHKLAPPRSTPQPTPTTPPTIERPAPTIAWVQPLTYSYDNLYQLVSAKLLARYIQSAATDRPMGELRSGTTSYYQQDGLGSVRSLSNSAGALANTHAYDSFGKLTASTGMLSNPIQYTGRDYDAETSLRYHHRTCDYDSVSGRFTSEDLI
jgi:YD repeat-containing protein